MNRDDGPRPSVPPPALAQAGRLPDRVAVALPAAGFWEHPAVLAVSGGADSVGLLFAVHGLAARRGSEAVARLVVAHAEHDLRPTAPRDRDFVLSLAAALGLRAVSRRLDVLAGGDRGEGIEATARRLRYGFLADAAGAHGCRHVLVAHTADDQAETILHRSLRGTGLAGLGGMPRARTLRDGIAVVRPLLGITRAEVREFLAALGGRWQEDETNADVTRSRNFLRHEILPRLADGPYPAAAAALVTLGRQAAAVAAALASAADHLLDLHGRRQAAGGWILRTRPLESLDRHLVAEVFVALWRREDWPRRHLTARHYTVLAGMVRGEPPPAVDLPGGLHARRCGDGLLAVGLSDARGRGPDSRPAAGSSR
jgi:tRNA(Ile)-lysidine synthase